MRRQLSFFAVQRLSIVALPRPHGWIRWLHCKRKSHSLVEVFHRRSGNRGLSAPGVQDEMQFAAQARIILAVGCLELSYVASLVLDNDNQKHYMRDGMLGCFTTF